MKQNDEVDVTSCLKSLENYMDKFPQKKSFRSKFMHFHVFIYNQKMFTKIFPNSQAL